MVGVAGNVLDAPSLGVAEGPELVALDRVNVDLLQLAPMVVAAVAGRVLEQLIDGAPVDVLEATNAAHRDSFKEQVQNPDALVRCQLISHW